MTQRIAEHRQRLETIRLQARKRFEHHATGLQIAGGLAQAFDELVLALWDQVLSGCTSDERETLEASTAIVAIGGSGRAEMAPYSDVDLLFLFQPDAEPLFSRVVAEVVRDGWDTGLKLGQSVRTTRDAVQAARSDIQFATALIERRLLWGSPALLNDLMRRFHQQVLRGRVAQFLADCVEARKAERSETGGGILQLQPDIKRSYGGLRDLHLIRWIGFALYGVCDLDSLRLRGALSNDDALRLSAAYDYLFALRINLHFHAGRPEDLLSRDDQLRIAAERGIAGTAGQLPVELFMQDYFRHSLVVADLADRFVARSVPTPWFRRVVQFLMTVRIDDVYRVGAGRIDVPRRDRSKVVGSLEEILQLYLTAARYRVLPADDLQELIKQHSSRFSDDLSSVTRQRFLLFLATPGKLGGLLRSLYRTGILEVVLPAFRHARCLLQFNQYHSYTVDEHTLRTIEVVERFEADRGPIGDAYRDIRHKEILHLALLLHDAGKGYEEDHSEVGKRLALDAADRFRLPESQRELLVFLVHRHLLMAELAFRRDASDPQVLLHFSHEVGSPETLKLLFVLTAADITAVGPGVWTGWKAELLTTLYERTMLWLSGDSEGLEETSRLKSIRRQVVNSLDPEFSPDETRRRLDLMPMHYVLATPPERICDDLRIVAARQPKDIHVEGRYDPETDTVAYRVITHEDVVTGCFHKLTGVLTAQGMEILSSGICTCQDGVIIDSYQVLDLDHDGEIPDFRIAEVAEAIRRVLAGNVDVETLLASRRRFGPARRVGPLSNLPMRVVIDNDWSDRYTIIEVFAHDRPGLLYLIARTIFRLELSVVRARISTHFDQVVDGFYVTDLDGRKIDDERRRQEIHDRLTEEILRFEQAAQGR